MSMAKKHHYLPQSYLKRFCVNDKIQVYDLQQEKLIPNQMINNIAHQRYYYAVTNDDGSKNNFIEEFFASSIDTYPSLIKTIEEGNNRISIEEKKDLSTFIAFQMVRIPRFEKWVNEASKRLLQVTIDISLSTKEGYESFKDFYEKETGKKFDVSHDELMRKKEEYSIEFLREHSLKQMFRVVDIDFVSYFWQKNWMILQAPDDYSFITSDAPVTLFHPQKLEDERYSVGIGTPGVQIYFPLSKSLMLCMKQHSDMLPLTDDIHRVNVEPDFVFGCNLITLSQADRFIYSPDIRTIQELIEKSKQSEL